MAKRSRQSIAKRARERARQKRQAEKRERRFATGDETTEAPDESVLMEEFRVLSERHAAGLVSEDDYSEDRQRIFEQLGIEDSTGATS